MTSEDYYKTCVQQFTKMLANLQKCLDKLQTHAETKKFEVGNVLTARLAPDQFNFIRQVQIICDTAKFCASRITGKEAPSYEDKEQTLDELRSRIQKTVAYLQTYKPADFQNVEARKISLPWMKEKALMGDTYFTTFAVPNFYFHFMTAYSILRHNGVDVGKQDYLGELPLV